MHSREFTNADMIALREMVAAMVARTPVTDIHTHLYAPAFKDLLLWGVDELLTYHYLVAEVLRATRIPYEQFWNKEQDEQADFIWDELFIKRSPISEACRGVLTVLDKLGLDVTARSLKDYRAWFASRSLDEHVDRVFDVANLKSVVMTNDPFDSAERAVWEQGFAGDERFHAVLRIDPLLNDWINTYPQLKSWGYHVDAKLSPKALTEVRRFLLDWLKRMNALYMAVSLPPDFVYPEDSARGKLISEAVLPAASEFGCPFAMMIGVKRRVNPHLRLASDGVGKADIRAVERMCAQHQDNTFMCTMLARENQHELTVAARKFPNLLLFGCWWFMNNPSLIDEMTRMRFELLGLSVVPQHSDARVLEQVIYKWDHSRAIIADVLADKYADLVQTGWVIREEEIERDVAALLDGNFWDFIR